MHKTFLSFLLTFLILTPALASDRHVFLDTDGNGILNDCPNPAHQTYYSADSIPCGSTFDIGGDGPYAMFFRQSAVPAVRPSW